MDITPVSTVLAEVGFGSPVLNVLVPNEQNYTTLLMQPRGEIEGSAEGVRNRDRDLAKLQFSRFLEDARETQADLVITPEYSMPWEVLCDNIKDGVIPEKGKLWALGCESIKYSELDEIKEEFAPFATVLYETMPPDPQRFTDPLAYVFLLGDDGNSKVVVLVQFKTYPMGDNDHFEISNLQTGAHVYQFDGQDIKLVSLICSDAFAFADEGHADALYDRALIVHIQLNGKPRQTQFRQYRDRLFRFGGNATELICLNWARNVQEWCGEVKKSWKNVGGSAWYLQPTGFDDRDETLAANHKRGLYYTWCDALRSHALFFNYKPATYFLEVTKVVHLGVPKSISRSRGPQLRRICIWDAAAKAWVEQEAADDGFPTLVAESGNAKDEIKRVAETNPFQAERILALCSGKISGDDWHTLPSLDSCVINESEIIYRVTYCQDTNENACDFRVARLKRLGRLWDILQGDENSLPSLQDIKGNISLNWSPDFPHQNIVSDKGQRATVIYMGEDSGIAQVEKVKKIAAECLRRYFSDDSDRRSSLQRLAVWYRDDKNQVVPFKPHQYVQIDEAFEASEYDIGRSE